MNDKINQLPDDAEVITGDAPIRYAGITGADIKALQSKLASAREVIEHYADPQQWRVIDDPEESGSVLMIYDGELQDARYTTGDFVARKWLDGE